MNKLALILAATTSLTWNHPVAAQTETTPQSEIATETNEYGIAYAQFTLANGLRTVVLPDSSYPNVLVGIWYDVGAGDEPPGKTGFAHLFEHLMFEQTEYRKGDYYEALEKAGAVYMNGTTGSDRTNYFQVVPPEAVDLALWLESDRMGYLLGGLNQQTLDAQRSVVQNEKRQGEEDSRSRAYEYRQRTAYPEGHPYRNGVIGSMEDLNAASLDDARDWYREYYGANNAVLVLSGNITPEAAQEKVERFFSEMPISRSKPAREVWVPVLEENRSAVFYENTSVSYLSRTYFLPPHTDRDAALMEVIAERLAGGADSLLHKRLVVQDELANFVSATAVGGDVSGEFEILVAMREGAQGEDVSAAIDRTIAELLNAGVSDEWLERTKHRRKVEFLSSLEVIAEVGMQAGEAAISTGDPMSFLNPLKTVQQMTGEDAISAARKWLGRNHYTLQILPKELQARPTGVATIDRSVVPAANVVLKAPTFPVAETAVLSNGVKVTLAPYRNDGIATVQMDFSFGLDTQRQGEPLIPTFAFTQLSSGTKRFNFEDLQVQKNRLAMNFDWNATPSFSTATFEVLTDDLEPSLDLALEIVTNPTYPAKELDREKAWFRNVLEEISVRPQNAVSWLYPRLAYGKGSNRDYFYTAEQVDSITHADLIEYHRREFRPERLSIFVAGDFNKQELLAHLEASFGSWTAAVEQPENSTPPEISFEPGTVWLLDDPGAQQSQVMTLMRMPEYDLASYPALDLMTRILGGGPTARLGANLREDKGWTYGYGASTVAQPRGKQLMLTSGKIETGQTAPAIREIIAEMAAIGSDRPVTADELANSKRAARSALTNAGVSREVIVANLARAQRFGAPPTKAIDDFERYDSVTLEQVQKLAREVISPDNIGILVIGDLQKVEQSIRSLKFGKVVVIDETGEVVR